MRDDDGYELLDAGGGRRLERFGARVVDRPAPSAASPPRAPTEAWAAADLRYERNRGWVGSGNDPWVIDFGGLQLELRPTEAGQVGLFPEHARLWPWLEQAARRRPDAEVLHLFACTGASTLALARAGARVTHVDAARSAVAWARRNAELSDLADRPIRWIVDDAVAFSAREARRGRRYDGIVLDPPSWGHGAGRAWRLEDDLTGLLGTCGRLLRAGGWLLLTTHSTGWDADRVAASIPPTFGDIREAATGDLSVEAESGVVLPLGVFLRVMIAP